jgi:tight adherence protein B
MGAVLGMILGVGLLLVWQGVRPRPEERPRRPDTARRRLSDLVAEAGLEGVTPGGLVAVCAASAAVAGAAFLAMSQVVTVSAAFAIIGGYAPIALVRHRARQRRAELRDLWPDAVDNLASAIRAGLSLPEALSQLGARGPEPLRPAFVAFGEDYRATGRFHESLDRLADRLADPTGDRIVESLRVARDVGGSDLGRLLRTLSGFLRDEARTRAELETRQGWVVNAARLAVAAPWIMLALMSTQDNALGAYSSPTGVLVLLAGAAVCAGAYRAMVRIGRLPDEVRVLR